MSAHLFVATGYLEDLPPAAKWVLAAMADSADEHTLLSAPGLPKLRAWSGLSRSQTLRVVKQLVDAGWLERHEPGRQGRRASFRVFPRGVPAIPHPDEVAARYAGEGRADATLEEISPPVDDAGDIHSDAPVEGRADATLTPLEGRISAREGRTATRPLQSSTSVSRAVAIAIPAAPTVDRPTPPARPSTPRGGFPGSRSSTTGPAPAPVIPRPTCPTHGLPGAVCARCAAEAADLGAGVAVARAELKRRRATRRQETPA